MEEESMNNQLTFSVHSGKLFLAQRGSRLLSFTIRVQDTAINQ